MMKSLILKVLASPRYIYFGLLFVAQSHAGLIDFETTATGGMPLDNGVITFSDQFMADGVAVSFGFDFDSNGTIDTKAVFEQIGSVGENKKNSGFVGSRGTDIAAPMFEAQLGSFFLRQSAAYKPFGIFHILYDADSPVTGASGEIWDIDGGKNVTEQFLVKAFNQNMLLASILSPLGTKNMELDGKPWVFGFNGLSDITRIEITFTGSKTSGIGLAFNNFSPIEDTREITSIPEPSTFALFAFSLIGLMSRQYKAKH